ncbi:MAG: hypothetical protein LBE89_04375 [Helicobacteraceae bacterium]|jgi:hypothetical protein|nr:hypothetical protein [Helicobacteraceae bacterium]
MLMPYEMDDLVDEARSAWFYVSARVADSGSKDLKRLQALESEAIDGYTSEGRDYVSIMNDIVEIEEKYKYKPYLPLQKTEKLTSKRMSKVV